MIKIYDIDDKLLMQAEVTSAAKREQEMSKSDYISLSFSAAEKVILPAGAYIYHTYKIDKVREVTRKFLLLESYEPTQSDECSWKYTPQFQHPKMILSKTPFFIYTRNSQNVEVKQNVWSFVGTTSVLSGKITDFLNKDLMFGECGWKVIFQKVTANTINVSFSDNDFISALTAITNAIGDNCEWHIDYDDEIIYIGKVLVGATPVVLEVGKNVGVPSINNSKEGYYNAFSIFGGTRNITQVNSKGENVSSGDIRLQLDEGVGTITIDGKECSYSIDKYSTLDLRADKTKEPLFAKVLDFSQIYPSLNTYVYNVRGRVKYVLDDNNKKIPISYNTDGSVKEYKTFTVWYMRLAYPTTEKVEGKKIINTTVDDGVTHYWYDFEITDDLLINGKNIGCSFEANFNTGALSTPLAGRGSNGDYVGFELTYHKEASSSHTSDDVSKDNFSVLAGDYEIIYQEDNEVIIPTNAAEMLIPRGENKPSLKCNITVLYNIAMANTIYYEDAQNRLLEKAKEEIVRLLSDLNNYEVKSYSDVFLEENPQLQIGQSVTYKDGHGYELSTRVLKLSTNIDYDFIQSITLGNQAIKGTITQLKEDVQTIIASGGNSGNGGGFSVSQLRSLIAKYGSDNFISKQFDDIAHGTITWEKIQKLVGGLLVGNFNSENGGSWTPDAEGRSHLVTDYLEVRMKAIFEELVIKKTSTIGGKEIISPAGGVVAHKVEEVTVTYNNVSQKAYRCYFLAEQDGDSVDNDFALEDQVRSESFNVRKGTYHKTGNHFFWRLIIGIDEEPVELDGKKYHYIDLSETDCATGSDVPMKGDVLSQCGNRSDPMRQSCLVFSAVDTYAPCVTLYHGINSYSFNNKEYVEYGVDKSGDKPKAFFRSYGDAYIGDRPTKDNNYEGDSYVKYDSEQKKVIIKAELSVKSTLQGNTLEETFKDIQKQFDQKAETWYQAEDPSIAWKTDLEKSEHKGDLWYNTTNGETSYWNGSSWQKQDIPDAVFDMIDGKSSIYVSKPSSYEECDLWILEAAYTLGGVAYTKGELVTAIRSNTTFNAADWTKKVIYTDDTEAKKAQASIKETQTNLTNLGNTVKSNRDAFDKFTENGYLDSSEIAAIAQDSKRLEDAFAAAEKSYNEVANSDVLSGTSQLTDLKAAFGTDTTGLLGAKKELIAYIADIVTRYNAADSDGKKNINSRVATLYDNFQAAYDTFYNKLGLASAYITSTIIGKLNAVIGDVATYNYLKEALSENASTDINGGLILSSLIALRDPKTGYVQSGINGIVDNTAKGNGIATWWGGYMNDGQVVGFDDKGDVTKNAATSLIRFDGSGYLANGAIYWGVDGKVHADPTSFIISEKNLGAYLAFFEPTWKSGSDGSSIKDLVALTPQAPFKTLTVSNDLSVEGKLKIGSITLSVVNGALKIDGNVYSTGGMSAYGEGTSNGGGLTASVKSYADIIKGTYTDNDLASIPNAYAIKALSNRIDNISSELGGLSLDWANITGKPSAFTPSAHTHKWVDITDRITKVSQLSNDSGYTTNKGTVTSVKLTLPTGLSLGTTKEITTSGTFAISLTSGYSIPTTSKQGQWDSAYNWYKLMTTDEETADGVINKWNEVVNFLTGIAQTDTLDGILSGINNSITEEANRAKKAEGANATNIATNKANITTLQGYFTNGSAKSAIKLTNARKLWGNSFDGTADISGSIVVPSGKYITIGNIKLEYDATNKALKITNTSTNEVANLYTSGGVSAYGVGTTSSGSTGGGGLNGTVKSYNDAKSLTSESLSEVASAYSVAALYSSINDAIGRINTLEGGSATSIEVTGSGNAVTGVSKSGTKLTFTKGATFLTSHQDISGKSDKTHTHSVKINGVTKTIAATGGTAVDLGTYLTSHQSLAAYLKSADAEKTYSKLGHTHAFSEITGKPTTLAGYGVTDGVNTVTLSGSGNAVTSASIDGHTLTLTKGTTFSVNGHTHTFASLTSKPTTIAGYGITDAYTKAQVNSTVAKYLPLAGGTITGALTVNGIATFKSKVAIGDIYIINDGSGNLYVQKTDGKTAANFYATGGITAFGASSVSGGTGGGLNGSVLGFEKATAMTSADNGDSSKTEVSFLATAWSIKQLNDKINAFGTGVFSDYLTIAAAKATYQPKGSYLTSHQTIYGLTIQKNGTSLGTYTPNSAAKTINVTVPTKLSELSNDSGYTKNTGTVTSVAVSVPTGLSVSGSPITTKGTIAIALASGYSIPTTAKQTAWDGAVSAKHTHSNKSVLDGITSAKVTHWDNAYDWYALMTTDEETADGIINKWNEVVSFLANIAQTDTLSGIVDGINKSISDEVTRAKKAEGANASGISTNKTNITTLQGYFTSGSAKKALQLTNARKLWGNSFNGTADINGSIIVPSGKYISIGNIKMEYDATNKALKITNTTTNEVANLYTSGGVSAYGVGTSQSSGGGLNGSVKAYADSIKLTTENLSEIASAYSIAVLNNSLNAAIGRISTLEGGSATSIETTGSGNAVTSVSKSGTKITFTKGSTFSLNGHTHTFASLTSKPTSLSGYGITDGVNAVSVTGSGNAVTAASVSGHTLTLTKGSSFSLSNHTHYIGTTQVQGSSAEQALTGITKIDNILKLSKASVTVNTSYKAEQNRLVIYGSTYGNDANYIKSAGKLSYGDGGPQLVFSTGENPDASGIQSAALVYTDHDTIGAGVSLSFVTNQGDAYFIAPHIKALTAFQGNLAWSYITNKPTTLSGFGITDGLRSVTQPSGSNVFVTGISTSGTAVTYTKSYTKKSLSAVGTSGWTNASTDGNIIPDMSFIAYWNGAYSGTSSNLAYCNKGAFGSFAIKNSLAFSELTSKPTTISGYGITDAYTKSQVDAIAAKYLPLTGGTLTGQLKIVASALNGAYNGLLIGDDCYIGDCNLGNTIGLMGVSNNNAGMVKFGKGGMQFGYNGSNHIASTTALWTNLNADLLDGENASAFTRIVGRQSIYTEGTAPYAYIHLFRIANKDSYSTINCEIDLRTRYHSAKIEIRITTNEVSYGEGKSSISIVKKVASGRSCSLWVLPTVQSSGYNYYDVYYQSGAWNSGSYGITLRGSNGNLVYEPKGTNLDSLPTGVSSVLDNIAVSANKLENARSLWGQFFNGTANVSGSISGTGNITSLADNSYDIGSNSNAYRYIYVNWIGAKSGNKFEIGANNSNFGEGICLTAGLNVGIGTNKPSHKLHVVGDIYTTTKVNINGIILEKDSNGDLKVNGNLYATGGISAYGTSSAGSGGGLSGSVLAWDSAIKMPNATNGSSDTTKTESSFLASAWSIKQLYNKVTNLEGGSAMNVSVSGSGNAVTSISKSGTTISVVKGSTFLTAHQSLAGYMKTETADAKYMYHSRKSIVSDLNSFATNSAAHIYEMFNVTNRPNSNPWVQVMNWGTGDSNFGFLLANDYSTNGHMYFRQKIAGSWKDWKTIIDSSNIGSQSVNYAASAGSVAWTNVSGRPSTMKNPSALSWSGYSSGSYDGSAAKSISIPNNTNQLTNGAGFITASASITGNAATATNADKLDGIHANGLLTAISNSDKGISITVGGTTKSVTNISANYASSAGNADTVDGYHESSFFRYRGGYDDASVTKDGVGLYGWAHTNTGHNNFHESYGDIINIQGYSSWRTRFDIGTSGRIRIMQGINTTKATEVGYLAYLHDNVASATKLQTTRTLWGQSFNGTANISGSMTGVGDMTLDAGARIKHGSGNLYIGNSDNSNWIGVQDICSQSSIGDDNWSLRTSGAAHFKDTTINGTATIKNLLSLVDGSHKGLKMGSTYISSLDGEVILQGNTALRFGNDAWDYNQWAGLKYDHSSKTVYLGIADGSIFKANSAQSGGVINLKQGISSVYTPALYAGGDIYHTGVYRMLWKNSKASTYLNVMNISQDDNGILTIGYGNFSNNKNVVLEGYNLNFRVGNDRGMKSMWLTYNNGNPVLSLDGNFYATGGVTAYKSSDERLKHDIHGVDSLAIIKAMGGTVAFRYNADNKDSIGWIAQRVLHNTFMQDLVEKDDKGFLKINYWSPKLIAVAFGAIEQVDDEVSRLKRRVRDLENEVEQLKSDRL